MSISLLEYKYHIHFRDVFWYLEIIENIPSPDTQIVFVQELNTHLTVESEDPVTITLSSYCRQRTEPVCPVNTFKHSKLVLSQIC